MRFSLLSSFQSAVLAVPGKTASEKLNNALILLQSAVNVMVDSDLDKLSKDKLAGIKQVSVLTTFLAGLFFKEKLQAFHYSSVHVVVVVLKT